MTSEVDQLIIKKGQDWPQNGTKRRISGCRAIAPRIE